MNLLAGLQPGRLHGLNWLSESTWEMLPGDVLRVHAPPRTDRFQDPAGKHVMDSSPFLYAMVTGDFAARVLVRPRFVTTWDAGCILVRHEAKLWAKLCFESTDLGTLAAVSVVTNGLSDDANGVNLEREDLWLQIVRVGNCFCMHYALDGRKWSMVRFFHLPMPAAVQVGIAAQSPAGPGTQVDFQHFAIAVGTVGNIRTGV